MVVRQRRVSRIDNLAGYLDEPHRLNAVLAFIATLDAPFLAREVEEGAGLPASIIIRVLRNLLKKGFLTRHQVPMTDRNLWRGGRQNPIRGGTRMTWLYRVATWEA